MSRREDLYALVVGLTPTALVGTVFIVIPVGFSLYLSLWDWPLLDHQRQFVGLGNWSRLLGDREFWGAFKVTLVYTLASVTTTTTLSLALAVALNRRLWGGPFYRLAFFLPAVLSTVVAALFWDWAFQPQVGPVNVILRKLGLVGPGWLADPSWALPALVLVYLWRFLGYDALILLAGLQTIPNVFYEVANLDGAGLWARFRHITWPLLRPTIALVSITGVIFAFQTFGPVYVLTGGGPARSTTTLVYYLYERAIGLREFGYGATIGWALFALVFPLVWWQFRKRAQG